jgi:hypothetical protein
MKAMIFGILYYILLLKTVICLFMSHAREIKVLFHQANILVNSAKWNLLAMFVYKIIISEHL